MTRAMTREEISEMSAQERLDLIEALWDSLAPEEVPVPDWHKRILRERLAEHERDPDEGISLEDLRRDLFSGR